MVFFLNYFYIILIEFTKTVETFLFTKYKYGIYIRHVNSQEILTKKLKSSFLS